MTYVDLQGYTWLFHRDGFVASEEGVDLDTEWGGLKGAFGASSFFVVKCSGQGKAIVATYGALRRVDLQAGQQYTVDSGHLVAWPESLPIEVHKVGGMKSLFLSGEGFVVTLTGPGTFFMQTRSEAAFVQLADAVPAQERQLTRGAAAGPTAAAAAGRQLLRRGARVRAP